MFVNHLADGILEQHDELIERFNLSLQLKNSVSQMIYKHAISTVVPSRPVKVHYEGMDDADTKGPGNE